MTVDAVLAAALLASVVLSNPLVIGMLASAAVCWGGFACRPEPVRRRLMHMVDADRLARGADLSKIPPDRVANELGSIVDVMHVALTSGLSISASLQLALGHLEPSSAIRHALSVHGAVHHLDETLDEFGGACGPHARAFAAAVVGSMRTGIPLAPELGRLGRELREHRRRRLEGKVRRLPVLLLFPLVLCVLPALGLVAIVPVLVAAFGG
ncbi:type II secretion system F family protein [Candidatus Poriferisodalis sp.]|uniref:type II secretion system F family protein n=1 Tax=Candidatus Poriferisodalis sp. TaxID=3101277 RepID=UPI003B0284BB